MSDTILARWCTRRPHKRSRTPRGQVPGWAAVALAVFASLGVLAYFNPTTALIVFVAYLAFSCTYAAVSPPARRRVASAFRWIALAVVAATGLAALGRYSPPLAFAAFILIWPIGGGVGLIPLARFERTLGGADRVAVACGNRDLALGLLPAVAAALAITLAGLPGWALSRSNALLPPALILLAAIPSPMP